MYCLYVELKIEYYMYFRSEGNIGISCSLLIFQCQLDGSYENIYHILGLYVLVFLSNSLIWFMLKAAITFI